MNKIQLILLICIFLISCKDKNNKYHLKTVFPNTINLQIDEKENSVVISIEDKYYILNEEYLKTKVKLISYEIKKKNTKIEQLNVQILKGDSIIYEEEINKLKIQKKFDQFQKNEIFLKTCKLIFKNFDDTEFWNWKGAILELSRRKNNKEKKYNGIFELLHQFSEECGTDFDENKVKAVDLLKEGLRLVNSAGMVNFWNQEEKINQEDLLNKANEIFILCSENPITKMDSIKIVNGVHIIQIEK